MNSEERELHMESIQADLHGKHPVQLHTCFTFNEFKEFSKDGCLPTARGGYFNFNLFHSLDDALKFHAYISRDFNIDPKVQLLKTHDLYFMSFYIGDQVLQEMMNSGKFTVFSRSGIARILKLTSEYYLSASELRLHEVSTKPFIEKTFIQSCC